MQKRLLLIPTVFVLAVVFMNFSTAQNTFGEVADCSNLHLIFARGSGEAIDDDNAEKFFTAIESRLPVNIHVQRHELGAFESSVHKYPAVDVGNPFNGNAAGALFSAGYSNDYGKSVDQGTSELIDYATSINSRCPNAHLILGGYSQGAQVIGQSLRDLSTQTRSMVDFVALFGDPKLDLPEGKGFNPPACDNKEFSPWRRQVPNCSTGSGSLFGREPYLPNDLQDKTGLWCNAVDFVCGSSKVFFINSGHAHYLDDDGPIDQAAAEIARRLKQTDDFHDDAIKIQPSPTAADSIGQDVVFIVENSTVMTPSYYTDFVIPNVTSIANKTVAAGGRVGLMTFNGCGRGDLKTNFTSLENKVDNVLWGVNHTPLYSPNCDISTSMYRAVQNAKIYMSWKPNVKRTIVLITKVAFKKPIEVVPGSTRHKDYAVKFALTPPDGSNTTIYPMVPDDIANSYNGANVDGSQMTLLSPSDIDTFIEENTLHPQLLAGLKGPNVVTHPGTPLTFDASTSLIYDDTITKYEWDFDGNGTIDATTAQPAIDHIYDSEFNGQLKVTVTTQTGLKDTAIKDVLIKNGELFAPLAKAPLNLKIAKTASSTVKLTWQAGDNRAAYWGISLNGVPLGKVAKDQFFINVSDVIMSQPNEFSVQAITAEGELGDGASVSLDNNEDTGFYGIFTDSANHLAGFTKNGISAVSNFLASIILTTHKTPPLPENSNDSSIDTSAPAQKTAPPPIILYLTGGTLTISLLSFGSWKLYRLLHGYR